MFTIAPEFRPTLRSYKDNRVIAHADVCVKTPDYSIFEYFEATKRGYAQACRFVRLIERGYSPDAARWLSRFAQADYYDFLTNFEVNMHDKLTDDVVDLIPEGFEVELPHLDNVSIHTKDCLYNDWLKYGDITLTAYSQGMMINVFELRHYCAVRAMTEDNVFAQ